MVAVRTLIRRQDGIAMPLALAMLLMITLVAAAVSATALSATHAANTDRKAKRALAAAEAGLQVANLRLNNAPLLGSSECLVGAPSGAECPAYGEGDLANGATYRFWVSQELAPGATCGAVPSQTQTGTERCITAAGIVHGERRRVQTRVLDLPTGSPIVPIPGVFALNRVEFINNSTIEGRVGSNGNVVSQNTLTVEGIDIGPTGSFSAGGPVIYTQPPSAPVRYSPDKTLATVPVGDTATVNQNASIVNSRGVTYSASDRSLTIDGDTLTLTESGDYNFCSLRFINEGRILLAPGVRANIFIDAPDEVRPGSGCPSGDGWGEITAQNKVWLNSPGNRDHFKLFVVGWDPASAYASSHGVNQLDFQNQLTVNGLLYAPHSQVDLRNDTVIDGASASYGITCHNKCAVTYGAGAATIDDPRRHYSVQGWRECRPLAPLAGDPESGC